MGNLNDLLVRQFVRALLLCQVIMTIIHFSIVVHGNVAHFLFHFTNVMVMVICDWHLGLLKFLDQAFRNVLTGHVDSLHGMRQGIALKDGNSVSDSLTTLSYETCCGTR